MGSFLDLRVRPQPDDVTCGPTCLHAIYEYFGEEVPLEGVIDEVLALDTSGTLAVLLAHHALVRGYRATIHTYNLHVFDPTWFGEGGTTDARALRGKLRSRAEVKEDAQLRFAIGAYLKFLELGGTLQFDELSADLIRSYLDRGLPILTGLSATYLYGSPRERGPGAGVVDDVGGEPVGHFVVLRGYRAGTGDEEHAEVLVADPLADNPRYGSGLYGVPIQRVIGAILLGVLTHDANFLVLEPGSGGVAG